MGLPHLVLIHRYFLFVYLSLFSARTVIHILLLGTVIYQFFPQGKRVIVDGISWRFPLLGLLNAVYVNLWASHYYIAGKVSQNSGFFAFLIDFSQPSFLLSLSARP